MRGGKGAGQRPRVVTRYDGAARTAHLSEAWDAADPSSVPGEGSTFLVSRQLALARFVKTLLHPDVPYRGGPVPASRELERVQVAQLALVLLETIFVVVPSRPLSLTSPPAHLPTVPMRSSR